MLSHTVMDVALHITGPVDVSRTIVLSNSQTMVARRGIYNAVSVDAKDSFGNPTEMDMKLLDMVVVKVCTRVLPTGASNELKTIPDVCFRMTM